MRKPLKGALWSGPVCLGYGQFVLKHYTRDIVLMVVGFACPVVFGVKVLEQVFIVFKKIE